LENKRSQKVLTEDMRLFGKIEDGKLSSRYSGVVINLGW